jgi:nitrite reductase/ring-hydroxylating ferredoxin subunit
MRGYHEPVVANETVAKPLPFPEHLRAPGTRGRPFEALSSLSELPVGSMRRVTRGDLDLLLVNTELGVCVVDDRCPHMSAPLSIGSLEGCVVGCPLHKGKFDLSSGDMVQLPTTGGLDADGGYHPPWTPAETPQKAEPTDLKAMARALTRVRRMRYYPVRITNDAIEVQLPE